jgi:hypothetical protein
MFNIIKDKAHADKIPNGHVAPGQVLRRAE